MVAGSASASASSAGPSSDGGGDGDAHWRALQPGGIPTLKSILSSTLFFAEAAVGALQARNAEVAPYTSEWPAAAALILNLERKRDEWRNVSREFNRERIPFARLANTCDARQGGNVTGPTEYECSLFHLLDASRGGDPSCPHRPPVAVTECECNPGASSGGIVGCSISHLRAWNLSRSTNRNSPFQVRRASDGGPSRSRRTHARTCADPRVCALPAAFHVPQVIAEDDALLQVGVARMDLLAAVSEATRITNGNWSSIIFSPSRPECLPDCQPCALRRSEPCQARNPWPARASLRCMSDHFAFDVCAAQGAAPVELEQRAPGVVSELDGDGRVDDHVRHLAPRHGRAPLARRLRGLWFGHRHDHV